MIEVKEPFDKCRTQLAYHKNKSIALPMSNLIEITLKNSLKWR